MLPGVLRELFRRRVPQILGAYLASGWIVLEFTDWLTVHYSLAPLFVEFFLMAWALLIPSVIMLAYYHGAPGRDEWTRVEKIGIPLNLIVAAAILFVSFSGRQLDSSLTTVRLEDETGSTVERSVPKAEFRKKVALFHFDNQTQDTSLEWLSSGIPWAANADLAQDMYIDTRVPFALTAVVGDRSNMAAVLRDAGFAGGAAVPLTVQRRIAEDLHVDHFLTGFFTADGGRLAVTTRLYETRSGRRVEERTYTGDDVFEIADSLSVQLKQDLAVTQPRTSDSAPDLPVAELVTTSLPAYRSFIDGLRGLIVAGDWEGAAVKLQQAVSIDSTFAIAHFARFRVSLFLEDAAGAQQALTAAMTHSYRLPERFQFFIKTRYYRLVEQDVEKALAVSQLNVELFPNDILAHVTLAELLEQLGRRRAAVEQYEQVLAMDTARYPLLLTIGSLYESLGALEEAESYYRRYAELFPTDHRSAAAQSGLLRRRGDYAAAKRMIDRALLLEPANVELLVDAAEIEFGLGNFDAARQQIDRALASAKSLFDRAAAFQALQDHYERRGQMGKAIAAMHEKWAIGEHGPRLVVLQHKLQDLRLYAEAGQPDVAFDSVAAIATRLNSPFDLFPAVGRIHVALALDDADLIDASLPGLDSLISDLGLEGLRPLSLYAAGRARESHGDCSGAIQHYEEALGLDPWHVDTEIHIASCLTTLNRSPEAIQRLEEALKVYPGNAEAHALVASAYLDLGNTAAARQHLDAALRIWEPADPTYSPAIQARARHAQLSRETPRG